MPRPPRAQPIDIPLHIIGRGCRGIPVLGDDDSRGHFVYLLNEVVKQYEWRVLDWVLMSNHHHLVVSLREQIWMPECIACMRFTPTSGTDGTHRWGTSGCADTRAPFLIQPSI